MGNVGTCDVCRYFTPNSTFRTPHFKHQVGGFDVAVDDAHLVRVVEGFGGLDAQLGDGAEEVAGVVGAESREGGRLTEVSANGEFARHRASGESAFGGTVSVPVGLSSVHGEQSLQSGRSFPVAESRLTATSGSDSDPCIPAMTSARVTPSTNRMA